MKTMVSKWGSSRGWDERSGMERQRAEGQVSEGQIQEGQVSEGQIQEGQILEGQIELLPRKHAATDFQTKKAGASLHLRGFRVY